MSRLVALVVACLILAWVQPAFAAPVDIDRAVWGMTPQQVQGLFPALVAQSSPPDSQAVRNIYKIAGPVEYGGRSWGGAAFIFDIGSNELVQISLESDRSQIPALLSWLTARYGAAFETVGRDEPPGQDFNVFVSRFDTPDGGEAMLQMISVQGGQITTVEFKPLDPAVRKEELRVRRLRALQAAGAAPYTGWLNTHWYMTPEEVQALYPAAWKNDLNWLILDGPFNWHGRTWLSVEFEFKRNIGLTSVLLRVEPNQVQAVEGELRQWYGQPIRTSGSLAEKSYIAAFDLPESGAVVEVFLLTLASNSGSGVMITPRRN